MHAWAKNAHKQKQICFKTAACTTLRTLPSAIVTYAKSVTLTLDDQWHELAYAQLENSSGAFCLTIALDPPCWQGVCSFSSHCCSPSSTRFMTGSGPPPLVQYLIAPQTASCRTFTDGALLSRNSMMNSIGPTWVIRILVFQYIYCQS